MVFAEELKRLRKKSNLTQEDLAEKCEVSRQAVAKWESGESMPDVYKVAQIASMFDVSMEELICGENQEQSKKNIARDIYMQFIDNMESFQYELFSSNLALLKKLKLTIRKSRIFFKKELVDGLLEQIKDFGIYYGDIWKKEEYKDIFEDKKGDEKNYYMEKIMPQKLEKVEKLLGDYLNLP